MTSKSIALQAPIPAFPTLGRPTVDLQPSRWLDRFRRHSLQKRLQRAVVDASNVVLGTSAVPFESLPDRHQLLAALDGRAGVAITLVTRGGLDDRNEIDRLARLDLDHAITVDVHLDAPTSPERFVALRAIARFAELGVATRLTLGTLGAPATGDQALGEQVLGDLVDEAAKHGVLDVVARDGSELDGAPHPRAALLYRLRLQNDLPRAQPGRG